MTIQFQANPLLEVSLTSDCNCEDYDDLTHTSYPADFCSGCYEDDKAMVEHMVFEWKDRTGFAGNYVRVNGTHVSWQGISITKVVHLSDLVEVLEVRGDYTLYFQLDNDKLSIRRTSHDEPTGAYFLVQPEYIMEDNDEQN
jgi:hypothetical protein